MDGGRKPRGPPNPRRGAFAAVTASSTPFSPADIATHWHRLCAPGWQMACEWLLRHREIRLTAPAPSAPIRQLPRCSTPTWSSPERTATGWKTWRTSIAICRAGLRSWWVPSRNEEGSGGRTQVFATWIGPRSDCGHGQPLDEAAHGVSARARPPTACPRSVRRTPPVAPALGTEQKRLGLVDRDGLRVNPNGRRSRHRDLRWPVRRMRAASRERG